MIKHYELEIDPDNPFYNCQLDRKKYANVLLDIVSTYNEGFVLAINNKWGTGKTTFIRMWEQELKKNGFQTVMFNAWENDFENNALTALMGELKSLTKKNIENQNFENALKNAATFTKNLAPIVVKAIVKRYVGESFENLAEGVAESIGEIFERDVNEYADKKKNIAEFKDSLKKFIADTSNGKPLIFIIDELDRCRPDYAVSILEQIKHFFSIPNIIFVLSIDKKQLGHAIRGVYGSDKIDTDEYLRRFIDIEYNIPEPETEKFVIYLYNYFNFDLFFKDETRLKFNIFQRDSRDFIETLIIFFKNKKLTLRQQEKIFLHIKLSINTFQLNNYFFPHLYVFLILMKFHDQDKYVKLKNKEFEIEEVQNYFYELIKDDIKENKINFYTWFEAYILFFYARFKYNSISRNKVLFKNISINNWELLTKSLVDNSENQNSFLNCLISFERDIDHTNFDTNFIFNKIDLLDTFQK